jgi:hypothetical protein
MIEQPVVREKSKITLHLYETFAAFVETARIVSLLGQNVTFDEKPEAFRGRCGSKQYRPTKPNKYGIKVYALVNVNLLQSYRSHRQGSRRRDRYGAPKRR